LCPKIKSRSKGYHFQTLDSIQKAVSDAIKTLTEADFLSCCEARKIRYGCYVEGDDAELDE
jgi:hypothetical protein